MLLLRIAFHRFLHQADQNKFLKVFLAPLFYLVERPQVPAQAPYMRSTLNVKRIIFLIHLCLMPALFFSVSLFGWRVFAMLLVAYAAGGVAEKLSALILRVKFNDWVFTYCLVFALILPPTLPFWMVALGIGAGVLLSKARVFHKQIFHPAVVGYCLLTLLFPLAMAASWIPSFSGDWMAWGEGEIFALLLLLGGLFLVLTKLISWRIIFSALVGASAFFIYSKGAAPALLMEELPRLFLSGSFLVALLFIATDSVSAPLSQKARWVYGFFIGVLSFAIPAYSHFTAGIIGAILVVNLFSPILDFISIQLFYRRRRKVRRTLS